MKVYLLLSFLESRRLILEASRDKNINTRLPPVGEGAVDAALQIRIIMFGLQCAVLQKIHLTRYTECGGRMR